MKRFVHFAAAALGVSILALSISSIAPKQADAAVATAVQVVNTPLPVSGTVDANVTGNVAVTVGNSAANPIPVHVVDGTSDQPYSLNVNINIANGGSGGTANGDTNGSQSFAVPAGKRLVVETVSMYRPGDIGQSVQVFVNTRLNNLYSAFAVPPAAANNSTYTGATQAMKFYADPGTRGLVNAFRSGSTGAESVTVAIAGHLVDVP
ncbi:MAG: hypothetical protein JWL71_1477 [Acidobacteria bacterium]|jgi:hypothetical protein|nr:hypothetical protein [Acidobacteriota bacterium]